jgi:hypothetical protein
MADQTTTGETFLLRYYECTITGTRNGKQDAKLIAKFCRCLIPGPFTKHTYIREGTTQSKRPNPVTRERQNGKQTDTNGPKNETYVHTNDKS